MKPFAFYRQIRLASALLYLAVLAGAALWLWQHTGISPPARQAEQRTTLSILRSRPVLLLTTRQVVFQIVVEHRETSWSGQWHALLWATARLDYGVDLQGLTAADLHCDGDGVVVNLPEPALLGFSIEPGSVGFFSKSTAVPRLADLLEGGSQRRLLEERLHDRALAFAADHDLLPTRAQLVAQLNEAVAPLAEAAGANIRFE